MNDKERAEKIANYAEDLLEEGTFAFDVLSDYIATQLEAVRQEAIAETWEKAADIAKQVGRVGYSTVRHGEYTEEIRYAKIEDTIAHAILSQASAPTQPKGE